MWYRLYVQWKYLKKKRKPPPPQKRERKPSHLLDLEEEGLAVSVELPGCMNTKWMNCKNSNQFEILQASISRVNSTILQTGTNSYSEFSSGTLRVNMTPFYRTKHHTVK